MNILHTKNVGNVKIFKVDLGSDDNTEMQNYILVAFNGKQIENPEKFEKYAKLLSTEMRQLERNRV